MDRRALKSLLLTCLGHQRAALRVHEAALEGAHDAQRLADEHESLDRGRRQERRLLDLCRVLRIDAEEGGIGRELARQVGGSAVEAVRAAREGGLPEAGRLAAECLLQMQTVTFGLWQLLDVCATQAPAPMAALLQPTVAAALDEQHAQLAAARRSVAELGVRWLGMPVPGAAGAAPRA